MVATPEALRLARERGLDLVLIAPASKPPVARIADYGKLRYELSKKEKEARKSSRSSSVKEVKLSPKIAQHDFEVRLAKTKELLGKGHKVKVNVMFRGREIAFTDIGRRMMEDIKSELANECVIDQEPRLEGRNMVMVVSPKK